MSAFSEFFLNSPSKVILYETVQITHPYFIKDYMIVRNARFGLKAKNENGVELEFAYYPIKIEVGGSNGTLDQSFRFTVGDLGTIINDELEQVALNDGFHIKPLVTYRAFRSDSLEAGPVYGPMKLEITSIPVNNEGFIFEAKPYQVNQNLTGEIYTLGRFSGLRGFI